MLLILIFVFHAVFIIILLALVKKERAKGQDFDLTYTKRCYYNIRFKCYFNIVKGDLRGLLKTQDDL